MGELSCSKASKEELIWKRFKSIEDDIIDLKIVIAKIGDIVFNRVRRNTAIAGN